jgi:Flp pilus assembly protein TadD
MKTLRIAVVALAIVCIATPTFAQGGKGGGGGGGGGRQNGGQAGGQGGGQKSGGNPGGGQRQGGGGSPNAGPRVGGGNPGGGGQRPSGGSPNIGQRPGGNPVIGVPSVRVPDARGNVNAGAGATIRQPQQPGRVNLPAVTGNVDGRVQGQVNTGRGNDGDRRFSNDPRFNAPRGNDSRFNNNNPQRTFADDSNFDRRNYDPRNSQVRINNRSFSYGNPNYRPSYSRYNWYNGYSAGPYGAYGNNRYGVGYRGGFGNNIGTTLLGLGLSSLTGGGYGYGGGLGGIGGGFGGYGGGLGYPAGWGLGGWGLGSMAYNSGVLAYNNPYYTGIGGANFAYNYAQPIPVALSSEPTVNEVATQNFDAARQQFMNGEYSAALASVDAAIKLTPTDAVMHEFRALTQFALGDYRNAAATIHSVLAVGPGWDWATMIGLYPNVDVYTNQLRALEQEVTKNTRQAETRFLLGYQYMAAGHSADAGKQFAIAAEIMPQDRVAADLSRLNSVDQTAAAAPAVDPAVQAPAAPAAPAVVVDPAKLVGDWKAERPDGSKFDVDFSPDNTFTWKFAQADKNQTLTGTYGIENDLLVLQSKDGGAMLGHVSLDADDKFTFKLLGTPATEQGLAFTR